MACRRNVRWRNIKSQHGQITDFASKSHWLFGATGAHHNPQVMNVLDIKMIDQQQIALEWESSASNDMIADSALALILGIDTSPASVKCK